MESLGIIKQYIPIKKAHILYYTKSPTDSQFNFILFRQNTDNIYQTISTDVTEGDNAPIFALAREISLNLPFILTDEGIRKIQSQEKLSEKDIELPRKNIPYHLIWQLPSFLSTLDKLSQNIVQYDDINDEVIYFIEIPFISLDTLNSQLTELNFYATFNYLNSSNINNLILSNELIKIFNALPFEKMVNHIQSSIEYINSGKADMYIVLACKKKGPGEKGFFHFPALFTGIYRKNKEDWRYLVASKEELPNEELLSKCKSIIIPGSELSIYNDYAFLRDTEAYMKKLIEDIIFNKKYPQLKILGVCFGMQLIITCLGGEVKFKEGIEVVRDPVEIELSDSFWDLKFVKESNVKKSKKLIMCQAHGDHVTKFPDSKYKITKYGWSKSCENEVFADDTGKIFLVQGHPEYGAAFMVVRAADWYLSFEKKEPTDENIIAFVNSYLAKDFVKKKNEAEWRSICYSFMKS